MDKLTREHIHMASAPQLAALLEITPQGLYESVKQNRIAISLHKIQIASQKAGMEVGELIQGLNDWIQARRKQKQLIQEFDQFLKKTIRDHAIAV